MKLTLVFGTLLGLLLTVSAVPQAQAGFPLISGSKIKKLIGPYPARNTDKEVADFDELLQWQDKRSEEECAVARADEKASFQNMFAGSRGPLTPAEGRRLRGRMLRYTWAIETNIFHAKSIYRRIRPFKRNSRIQPCVKRPESHAYPSGHTASARAYARILSKIYPSRAQAFMDRADEIAHLRVLGGVHHPTDIVAGKKLGDAIAVRLVGR